MGVEFRQIPGHPDYYVSNTGLIKSRKWGKVRLLKPKLDASGYNRVGLYTDGKFKNMLVHRVVAQVFISNDGKRQVNHIDGDKSNNHVINLEWCTISENVRHSYDILKRKPSYRKAVRCIETGIEYDSALQASRLTGINYVCIGNVTRGTQSKAGGFTWERI